MAEKLRLRAADADDLAVISACLQDALLPIADMTYLPEENRFALVANRFRWEAELAEVKECRERTLSGVAFESVRAVKVRGFDPNDSQRILEILAIRSVPRAILIDFSGDGTIRLEVGEILCHLEDLGEPWPTQWCPRHPGVHA